MSPCRETNQRQSPGHRLHHVHFGLHPLILGLIDPDLTAHLGEHLRVGISGPKSRFRFAADRPRWFAADLFDALDAEHISVRSSIMNLRSSARSISCFAFSDADSRRRLATSL